MAAVEAGLSGASVSITELGRTLSGPAYIKHKIKRLDRLAGNHHLKTERMALYGTMAQLLLKSLPLPLVIVDWSPLTDDQSQQLLSASLPVGGRTITLYEEVHPDSLWVTAESSITIGKHSIRTAPSARRTCYSC